MKHRSLRFRLMGVMLALAVVPVATVTWYAANNTKNSVEDEMISANTSRMAWSRQYLESQLDGMQSLFDSLQIDTQFESDFNNFSNEDSMRQLQTQNSLFDTLSKAFFAHSSEIDNLSLYIAAGREKLSVDFANPGSIAAVDLPNSNWSPMKKGPLYLYFRQEGDAVYAYHSINRFDNHALLGGISVQLSKSVWNEVYSILNPEGDGAVYILDAGGTFLDNAGGSGDQAVKEEFARAGVRNSGMQFFRTKENLYFIQPIGDGLLTVVRTVPLSAVEKSVRRTMMAGLLIGLLAIALAVLLSVLVSLHITQPIVRLVKTMKHVQIHEFKMEPVQNNDEIGLLEKGYNGMMQRIKQLIEVEYTQEMEVKNAQIRALQSQINPHFLNNTLQLIGGMALSKNAPDIYAVTNVMSRMMRYAMDAGVRMVKLSDELGQVRNYICIQQYRFDGRFSFCLQMDEALSPNSVPQFILQPVIENAFEHGLRHKKGQWMIGMAIRRRGNRIGIAVFDNGVGMEAQTLARIRMELRGAASAENPGAEEAKKARCGIGLRNIQSRLRLQFGSGYGVRVFSREGSGSLVMLELPVSRETEGGEGGC